MHYRVLQQGVKEEINLDVLKQLYREMLRIRMAEEAVAAEYSNQEMRCPVHLSIGQEAVAVGVCSVLRTEDVVYSSHRAHAHYLAKGGDLMAMIAELYLRADGTCGGRGGSMHLIDMKVGFWGGIPIVASGIPMAVGAAWAFTQKKLPQVAVVFFGDAATEEGAFFESLNFAALKKLPVVFICENNLYSVNTPLAMRQPVDRKITDLAEALNVKSVAGDGNRVDEVRKLACQVVEDARRGKGPVLLELCTYRWVEHCGPNYDLDSGERESEEIKHWKERDPLQYADLLVGAGGYWEENEKESMRRAIAKEVENAFNFAKDSPTPQQSTLYDRVFPE